MRVYGAFLFLLNMYMLIYALHHHKADVFPWAALGLVSGALLMIPRRS
jgi:hypothetical protein